MSNGWRLRLWIVRIDFHLSPVAVSVLTAGDHAAHHEAGTVAVSDSDVTKVAGEQVNQGKAQDPKGDDVERQHLKHRLRGADDPVQDEIDAQERVKIGGRLEV